MAKYFKILLFSILLLSCSPQKFQNSVSKPREIVANVQYTLKTEKFYVYKVYNNKLIEWYFSTDNVSIYNTPYVSREDLPESTKYANEDDNIYHYLNLFYNYGTSCAIINLR